MADNTFNEELCGKDNLEQFLRELSELSAKYDLWIGGCGCCGSPYIITGDGKGIADYLAVASDDTYYTIPH